MDGNLEKKWFVYLEDHHEGPFSIQEIESKMTEGKVRSQNFVWAEGMSDWEPMPTVPDFQNLVQKLEPPIKEVSPIEQKEEPSFSFKTNLNKEADPLEEPFHAPLWTPPQKTSTPWLKITCLFIIPIGIGFVFYKGYLNSFIRKTHSQTLFVEKWIEKIPFLSQWFSPLPVISDLTSEDYEELKTAARAKPGQDGPKTAIALSTREHSMPSFYLATDLPEGAKFEYFLEGIPNTLLNHMSFSSQGHFSISKKLGKTPPIGFPDGQPIPRGEYWVYVVEAQDQPSDVSSLLTSLETAKIELPDKLPKGKKLIAKKTFFLGGLKDTVYEERLKEFHEKIKLKVKNELDEIKQFTQTLDSQIQASTSEFNRVKQIKSQPQQQKGWKNFHEKWTHLESQLNETFTKWTPQITQNEFFFGKLYTLIQTVGDRTDKLHMVQNSYFTAPVDLKSFEIQLGEATAQTQTSLSELRAKSEEAEKQENEHEHEH